MAAYVGEIRLWGGNFAPAGWMFCDGQLLPISENEVLFQLIGTTYGGDGQETFALPDLQGRLPVHTGGLLNYQIGEQGGVEAVTLTTQQIPVHSHPLVSSNNPADQSTPSNAAILASMGPAGIAQVPVYKAFGGTQVILNASSIGPVGGSQPHNNVQPTLCISYIISLFGIFPSQT